MNHSFLRDLKYYNLEKAEGHFLIAISQKYIPAILNYANLLKNDKGESIKANQLLMKARKLDKKNIYKDLIDLLIKS